MIKNYGMYNYHDQNNKLVILFDPSYNEEIKINDEVSILKNDSSLAGYVFTNFIKYVKIKYSGIIFLPSDILIDIINSILKNASLETLDYKKVSGYEVRTIDNKKVVYATEGTFLRDETISKGKICSYYDLDINIENSSSQFELDEDIKDNTDFFLTEAR